jgi:hypothetical protein
MTQFDSGQGSTSHQTTLQGLNPNTHVVNDIHVRCSTQADYLMRLKYRCLPVSNADYPRTVDLWGWWNYYDKGLEYMARIDLWQGADIPTSDILELSRLNPHILILTSINTVENFNLPDNFYLKTIKGEKIEVWPNVYRLNMTKPQVASYQAQFACQQIKDNGLMVDGCIFDNFMTAQSWLKTDIHGTPIQIDANEDGEEDDPDWLDPEWRNGVFAVLHEW